MSVRCIGEVLDRSVHSGTELLMLVVLADYSDDEGNSYPSVASLARKCRMSPRNANYILSALQASGELRVHKNAGPKATNRYRIMLAALGAGVQCASPLKIGSPLKPASATPEAGFPKPLKPASDKPSLNRQEPKTARKRAAPMALMSVDDLVNAGVDRQHASDWLAVRKVKRLPLTMTAWDETQGEAAKAGITIAEAIQRAAAEGWGGFKAKWMQPSSDTTRGDSNNRRSHLSATEVFT